VVVPAPVRWLAAIPGLHDRAAAHATLHHPGEQILRVKGSNRARGAALEAIGLLPTVKCLVRLRPQVVADDAEMFGGGDDPFIRWPIAFFPAPPGVALFRAPPDDLALVERVEEDRADA